MQRRFHRSEAHETVPVSCMRRSSERQLTMEAATVRLLDMRDSEEIIQNAL